MKKLIPINIAYSSLISKKKRKRILKVQPFPDDWVDSPKKIKEDNSYKTYYKNEKIEREEIQLKY